MSEVSFSSGPAPKFFRVSGEAFQFLRELAKHFPAEVRKAHGWVGSAILKRMRKTMAIGGGIHGVPRFPPHSFITAVLRRTPRPLGGVLARPTSFVMFKSRSSIVLGWPTGLDPYAQAFQTEEKRAFTKEERKMIYRAAGWDKNVIHAVRSWGYDRPARPLIEPLMEQVSPEIPKWITSAVLKAIANSKKAAKMGASIKLESAA